MSDWYMGSQEDLDYYLMHYGVPGMKWGVRKQSAGSGGSAQQARRKKIAKRVALGLAGTAAAAAVGYGAYKYGKANNTQYYRRAVNAANSARRAVTNGVSRVQNNANYQRALNGARGAMNSARNGARRAASNARNSINNGVAGVKRNANYQRALNGARGIRNGISNGISNARRSSNINSAMRDFNRSAANASKAFSGKSSSGASYQRALNGVRNAMNSARTGISSGARNMANGARSAATNARRAINNGVSGVQRNANYQRAVNGARGVQKTINDGIANAKRINEINSAMRDFNRSAANASKVFSGKRKRRW